MGAIEYKKTDLADPSTEWDGPAEVAAAEVEDLKAMCAWYDAERPDVKESYKLPHHRARDHACVLAGVRSALRLLNATDMPEDDRPAVRRHLERHLDDFGVAGRAAAVGASHVRAVYVGTIQQSPVGAIHELPLQTVHELPLQEGEGRLESLHHAGLCHQYFVRAISAGDANGLHYSDAVLQAALPLFEGATVFVDHAQMPEMHSFTGGRSLRNVLGVLEGCHWEAGARAIDGVLRVLPGPDADWFCAMVDEHLADKQAGRPTARIGLSAVMDVKTNGKEVVSIERVLSVDAVFDPARGGEFVRALNQASRGDRPVARTTVKSKEAKRVEEENNNPVGAGRCGPVGAGRCGPVVSGANGKQSVLDGAAVSAEADAAEMPAVAGASAPTTNGGDLVALSQAVMEMRLAQTQLPDALKGLLRQEFKSGVVDIGALDARIEALQAAWARSLSERGVVQGLGESRVTSHEPRGASGELQVGLCEIDRLQAVMDKLCGLRLASEALQGIRPVSGIRELYLLTTGDYEFRGVFDAQRVGLANVTTSTMTSLVKNAFNKVIMDYFNTIDRWWEPIVSEEEFESTKQLTLITLGGFVDLPTVAEGEAYTELEWSDAEEAVSFVKKGGYVGVTLEMMDRDETRAFRAIPRKLAIAGYRALSAAIASLWLANNGVGAYWPSGQSTYRLFCSNYGNLGTSALSASAWDAVIQAMYKQTEATSGKRMGIRPAYLVVPIELEKTALTIMQSEGEPGTADNDANVRRGSSRVVVCPEMTDANDWLAVAEPRVWPGIVVGYRFGRTPEVFVADQEVAGSMFTNDEMRIKARFFFATGVADYRPLYKSNVA